MRASRILLVAGVACVLSACDRDQDATNNTVVSASPPSAAALDVRRPLNALGTEPFWSLKIRPEGLSYSDPETPQLDAADAVFTPNGAEAATWTAGTTDGRRMTVKLEAKPCRNGMADLSYPFSASITVGGRTMTGCAAYADDMPRAGG